GKPLLQVLAVPLDRRPERPVVHPVGSDPHQAAAATGPKRQDLVEAVEQAGPLFGLDEPFQLRPVGGELWLDKPLTQMGKGLFLDGIVHFDGTKSALGMGQQIHDLPRRTAGMNSQGKRPRKSATVSRGVKGDNAASQSA